MTLLLARNHRVCGGWHSSSTSLACRAFSSSATPTTFAILKETYNVWERRAPLTPTNVRKLLATGRQLRVLVEPCSRRAFSDAEYAEAGAIVTHDLSQADVLLSVKRPRNVTALLPDKTYLMFSHTIKGQDENMPLLRECLDKRIQLLDYERMVRPVVSAKPTSKRLVAFGRFAGLAGAIDSLSVIGKRLLYTHGTNSCLLNVPPAWQFDSVQDAKRHVERIGELMLLQRQHSSDEAVSSVNPLVLAVTGKGGCVHGGVMELLSLLPHEIVSVEDLPTLSSEWRNREGYPICIVPVGMDDVFVRCDGASFDRQDFAKHSSQYRSVFARKVAPFVHAVYNCAYWDARYPRLLTKSQIERLCRGDYGGLDDDNKQKLMLVADISCVVGGSMELLERTTTIESPCYTYDPY